ncbi:MAG: hypothetical protein IPH06_10180 [Alphaproteobacteria bacterium]|nr:hypothetical protein [Alphaproteobacteria bacterium]QQS58353.1 MAG: hypothetical protein IPN28_05935 [Alphaproteobacteria bacterium]
MKALRLGNVKLFSTAGYYARLDVETLKTFRIGAYICLVITLSHFVYKIVLHDLYFGNNFDPLETILCFISIAVEIDAILKTSAGMKKKRQE